MAGEYVREVDFFQYCKKCANRECLQTEDPCNECLSCPGRIGTRQPLHYKSIEEEK